MPTEHDLEPKTGEDAGQSAKPSVSGTTLLGQAPADGTAPGTPPSATVLDTSLGLQATSGATTAADAKDTTSDAPATQKTTPGVAPINVAAAAPNLPTEEPAAGSQSITSELPAMDRRRANRFREALGTGESTESRLDTFRGVFRPTLLTILGVMMYLRLGWVVGEAGLLGALAIVGLIFGITVPTAMSLASITTNVRLGAGGVFALIAQSLGLETGGAIGIPLYLAQALSAGLYLYGFTETWVHIFPSHPHAAVLGCVFLVITLTVAFTQELAFRLQGIVLWIGIVAMATIALGLPGFETASVEVAQSPEWWGQFPDADFWHVFAVFFPAGTGIMVGAGMSGDLKNPRRSIPRGTLLAVGTAFAVYVAFAVWYGIMATPAELRDNYLIVAERSAFGPIVLAGVLASTFTAALSSMVTAPRLLKSLADYKVLPRGETFAGNLRNASLFTAVLVALVLLLGSLDRVAVLITMVFLLTYLVVNVVVLIEQSLSMVSFRPTFRVPILVPICGAVGSAMASFIVGPAFAMMAIGLVLATYVWLLNRHLETPWETVRSSVFVSLVGWASRHVNTGPDDHNERSWKPDLLVPVTSRAQLDGSFRFLRAMAAPKGSLQVVGVTHEQIRDRCRLDDLYEATQEFRHDGLHVTATVLEADDLVVGVRQCCAVLAGSQFRPNVLYGLVQQHTQETLQALIDTSVDFEIGAAFLEIHPEAGFGHERTINLWVRDQSPDWHVGLRLANLDLAILFAYQIGRNWNAKIRMISVVRDPAEAPRAKAYLQQLIDDARLPGSTKLLVMEGSFVEAISNAPHADLQIMGLAPKVDQAMLQDFMHRAGSSILFVRDSGRESALA